MTNLPIDDETANTELRADNVRRMEALAKDGIMVHPQVLEGLRVATTVDHIAWKLLDETDQVKMDLDYAGRISNLLDAAEKEAAVAKEAMLMQRFGVGQNGPGA